MAIIVLGAILLLSMWYICFLLSIKEKGMALHEKCLLMEVVLQDAGQRKGLIVNAARKKRVH